MKVRLSASDSEYELDDALWVDISDQCGSARHYLVGNPHTYPGRMEVYCPALQRFTRISMSAIISCSQESRYWIQGYLHGTCPDPPTDDDGNILTDDHPDMAEWRASREEFPRTGYWSTVPQRCNYCRKRVTRTARDPVCQDCTAIDEDAGMLRAKKLDDLLVARLGGVFEVARQEGKSKPFIVVSERIPTLERALCTVVEEADAFKVRVTYCGPDGDHEICAERYRDEVVMKWYGLGGLWRQATEEDEAWVRGQAGGQL